MSIETKHWADYVTSGTKYNKEISQEMLENEGETVIRSRKHHGSQAVQYDRQYALNKIAYTTFSRIPSMSFNDWQELLSEAYEEYQNNGGVLL